MSRWLYMLLVMIVCTVSMLLAGCQVKDVDKRSFVLAFGIDSVAENEGSEKSEKSEKSGQNGNKDNLIEITLKLAIPEGDPTKRNQEAVMISQISDSIPEAIRLLKSKVDKELDFSHCKTLLFGESYAKKNITQVSDWMVRRRDIQLVAYNGVARPNAKEVLTLRPKSERVPANALILSLGKEGTESPFIVSIYSYNFRRHLSERGLDPILPLVEINGEDKDTLLINKSVLLDKQKVRAELTPEESRLYNLLKTRNLRTSFNVEMEGNMYSYNMETTHSKFKLITSKEGKMVVHYDVGGRAVLEENAQGIDMKDQILFQTVSKAASKQWEKDIKQFLMKIHRTGLDPLGWGLRYSAMNWNNATEIEDWERIYPQLEFNVKANVKIDYSGIIR